MFVKFCQKYINHNGISLLEIRHVMSVEQSSLLSFLYSQVIYEDFVSKVRVNQTDAKTLMDKLKSAIISLK